MEHLRDIQRVYGPGTWDVYKLLERSLEPRGSASMVQLATDQLTPDSLVLDVGCRDCDWLIRLVGATKARGIGVDPVGLLLEQARVTIDGAGLQSRIGMVQGALPHLPLPDGSVDLVWCRDVIELVPDLSRAVLEVARVLKGGGWLALYTVFATNLLEPKERAMLNHNLAVVPANLDEGVVERAFEAAGMTIAVKDVIGTEWREQAEEARHVVSGELLQLARLRRQRQRQRQRIIDEFSEDVYRHIESNLHWSAWQFLGKLQPTVYLLQKARY